MKINIEQEHLGTLCITAIRYCQGRQTGLADLVRGIVTPFLPEISDMHLAVMVDDCDFQAQMHLYGDEIIDKPGWLRWKETLLKERERRRNCGTNDR